MAEIPISLSQVKRYISRLADKKVQVTQNLGRTKFITFLGRLSGVYHALFTIEPFDKKFRGRTAYSYSDFICGKVRVIEKTD